MDAIFYIEHETEEYIHIIDTGIQEKSVRADARAIVTFLNENHNLGKRRVIFRNRLGIDNEIRHINGEYKYLCLGHKDIVLPKDSDALLECMVRLAQLRDGDNYKQTM